MQDTSPSSSIRRVVIAGGGTAGWMVAALMSKLMGHQLDIRLVESEELGTVGVGEATIPALHLFHEMLGIDEAEFMAATQATFKLGIRFEGWHSPGVDYIHSFGKTGRDHWSADFQHFWLAAQRRGIAGPYGDYCLEHRACEVQRFGHSPEGGLNYAYHLDASRYASFLRRMSEGAGVQRVEGRICRVEQAPSGDIAALHLENGARIEGDLFIDCTGFRALLIGQALGVPYQDWSHWLPCDRAVAVQTATVRDAPPFTRAIAHPFGWQWRIPLQHRVGNGLVYSSQELSDLDAPETLLRHVEGEALIQPRVIKFQPGQRERVWERNCIAVGLSSGFIEPLESTSIHLIQRAAIRLLRLFPTDAIRAVDVLEFNRQTTHDLADIRDFIILHYHVTQRDDSAFWRHVRNMSVPDTLKHRIELFAQTGRVFRPADGLFAENSWVQVLMGQGITPLAYHPVADKMGLAELNAFMGGIRSDIEHRLQRMPKHQDYVLRYGRARSHNGSPVLQTAEDLRSVA